MIYLNFQGYLRIFLLVLWVGGRGLISLTQHRVRPLFTNIRSLNKNLSLPSTIFWFLVISPKTDFKLRRLRFRSALCRKHQFKIMFNHDNFQMLVSIDTIYNFDNICRKVAWKGVKITRLSR